MADDTRYWFVDMKGFLGKAFDRSHPLWMRDPRAGNEVKILLNGQETYWAMVKALDPRPLKWPEGSFIYLANWIVFDDFNLQRDPQNPLKSIWNTTLRDLLKRASEHCVIIRALFWDRSFWIEDSDQNVEPRDFINKLPTGHAILDGRVINIEENIGSHHQKFLLVNGPEGLLAFAGGLDFHPDRVVGYNDLLDDQHQPHSRGAKTKRLDDPHEKGAPLLDVHVRIRGPAVFDLLDIFLRRYADHPSAAGKKIYAPHRDYEPRPDGGVTVRVCTTFGDHPIADDTNVAPTDDTLKLLEGPQTGGYFRKWNVVTIAQKGPSIRTRGIQPYSFAPRGRQSGRAQLLYAISGARKFIYFEDQYMVSQEIAEAIWDVVSNYDVKVLGVIPHQSISDDFDQAGYKNVLASTRLERVIYVLPAGLFLFSPLQTHPRPQGSSYEYIHSKVFIMDDAFCTIGSMNFNRRSTTHDSELSLGFYVPNPRTNSFAKQLRLSLWQRHLGVSTSQLKLIDDPLESIKNVWSKIGASPSAIEVPGDLLKPNVVRYDSSGDHILGRGATILVDNIADPVVRRDETKRLPRR